MMKVLLLCACVLLPIPAWATTILILGDSLSAAYGIPVTKGWVSLLEKQLRQEQPEIRLVNASISGETSVGGLRRLPALLKRHAPDILIIELGGNDGLRGIMPKQMERNLTAMIELAKSEGVKVLLLGMKIPSNYGPRFSRQFEEVYRRLAKQHDLAFVPFFLADVALDATLMQNDGIHPNVEAQPLLAERVRKALLPLLREAEPPAPSKQPIEQRSPQKTLLE